MEKCGRTTHLQPEPPKDAPPEYDPAVALKELEGKDPYEPRLKPLSTDARIFINHYIKIACGDWKYSWTVKVVGDSTVYKEEFKDAQFTNGVIVLRSLIWPGAHMLYSEGRWFSFYVGQGHKADYKDYYPVCPPIPQVEPVDVLEQPEPNPKDMPKEENKPLDPTSAKEILKMLDETLNNPEKFNELVFKTFDTIDKDHSGQIDKSEADKFLKDFIKELNVPVQPTPEVIDEFFKLFDADKSGTISKEELIEPLKALLGVWTNVVKQAAEALPA